MKRHQRFCAICHKRAVYGKDICCAHCLLEKHLGDLGIGFDREYRFHPSRKWRFDFALRLTQQLYAIEIDGGTWTNGRHTRGKGFEGDLRKLNAAIRLGWRVMRFTPNMVQRAEDKAFLAELFGGAK